MGNIQRAISILQSNPQQNIYPLLRIAQGGIDEIHFEENSVLLHDGEYNKYMYSVENLEAFEALFSRVRPAGGPLISLVTNDALALDIARLYPDMQVDSYRQLVPPKTLPVEELPGIAFGKVGEELTGWILKVYKHPEITKSFIANKGKHMPNVAAFANGKPVGFFMMHSPAELGPAYVEPAYRGGELARQLFARILTQLPQGACPAIFVAMQNERSYRWLIKLGARPCKSDIVWFWRPDAE